MKSKLKDEKIEILVLIRKTIRNFRYNIKEVLIFEIIYRLITLFVLIPLNLGIIHFFMGLSGVDIITNKQILQLSLTGKGLFCIFVILVISFWMIFFQIGALAYIGAKSHRKERVKLVDGVSHSMKILRDTFDIGMIPLILLTGVIGPFTGIGLCSSLIRDFTIPPFITIELSKTLGGKILYGILFVFIILLFLRILLAIPIVVIEKVTGREGVKKSFKLYKRNKWKFSRGIILWVIFISSFFIIALFSIIFAGVLGGKLLGSTTGLSKIFLGGTTIIFYLIFVVISLLSTPLFISFLVELYYSLRDYKAKERDFEVEIFYRQKKVYKKINSFKNLIVIGLIVCFITITVLNGAEIFKKTIFNNQIEVTAHRGSSTAPENSISAVKNAIGEGANFAEIDVQLSKDGKVVLFHDNTLKRINGENHKIKDLTLSEIKSIDGGSYFNPSYKGEKIPTLNEILKISKGKIKLNIELKPMDGNEESLVLKTLQDIKSNNMESDVVITSINYKSLQIVRRLDPTMETGYIVLARVGKLEHLNVNFFSLESSLVTPKLVYTLHALNKGVHVFTVNNKKLTSKMVYLGVDNIITDNVPLIKATVEKMKSNKEQDYVTLYYKGVLNILRYSQI